MPSRNSEFITPFLVTTEKNFPRQLSIKLKLHATMLLHGSVVLLIFCGCYVIGRPSEEPTKFDLIPKNHTLEAISVRVPTRLQQGKEILGRIMDAMRFGRGRLVNSASMARNIIANRVEEAASEVQNTVISAIAAKGDILSEGRDVITSNLPPRTRETVKLEKESEQAILERRKSNSVSAVLESILKPVPLVDRIREEEKYGNSGDRFSGIGRALVNGFEGFSNFLNSVVDLPINAAKKTSRSFTEALNQLGSRIIGLQ
ncbi:uncharacterized protein LOC105703811 [Orussus abietinus]|uniref:uncharacterized protein LOC105703811 n=1 Tax=Orussus abietinus TaxID=222816 RepID=UPI000C715E05|nr:uncharacterized protein LOC105703811 [Orussus abietinus]